MTGGGTEGLAIAALVVALVSFFGLFVFLIPPVVAIVLAAVARRRINAHPGRGGKGMTTAALIIATVLLVAGIVLDVVIVVTARNEVRYSRLVPGDCIEEPSGGQVTTVTRQGCGGAHQREVFAILDDPAGPGSPYPGESAVQQLGERECMARFENYVGAPPDRSALKVQLLYPRRVSWERTDNRRIVCIVGNRDGSSLTGSVRDSGR